MSKNSHHRYTAYQGRRTIATYRTIKAMTEDLGVQAYWNTATTGQLLRNGQAQGTWERWSVS